jgi:hypothetical protein
LNRFEKLAIANNYENSQITDKFFISLGNGTYVIKLFTTVIYERANYAGDFVPGRPLQPHLGARSGAYPGGEHLTRLERPTG